MVTHCASDIIDALNSVSSDKSIQCDDSSEESDRDISNVRIIGSEDRQRVEVDESGSSLSPNSTHSGTVAKSLLECLQTPKHSLLRRKRRVHCNPPVGKRKCKGAKPSKGAVSVRLMYLRM